MRPLLIAMLIGSALGAGMQGSFLVFVLLLMGVEYVLVPFALILLVAGLIQRIRGKLNGQLFKVRWQAWGTLACGLFFMWGAGRLVNLYEVASVHSYVANAIPLLEQVKMRDGSYPKILPILQLGAPPLLLRGDDGYTCDGKEFHFRYSNPAEFVGEGEQFDSATKQWSHYDPMG